MPTSFTVFSLGQLSIWDPVEGNELLSTAAVNNALGTYGSAGDPLFNDRQEFAPTGTGFSGGDATAYDIDNNVSNDQFSIDGGPAQSHDATMLFNATITYTDGTTATISAVVFQDTAGNTYWAPEFTENADQAAINAKPIQSLELTSPIYVGGTANGGFSLTGNRADSMPLCFCSDALIACPDGERTVQDLIVGDVVLTQDHGAQPIRWIGSRVIKRSELEANPNLRPVRIVKGALGEGLPRRDLLLSRQHRVLVQSKIAKRMFDHEEILLPAIKLTEFPGIFVDEEIDTVTYYHVLLDAHEVMYAEGTPTESLFTGPEALKSVSPEARAEIIAIFPEIVRLKHASEPVRYVPPGHKQKELVVRHLKNDRPLISKP